MSSWQYEAEADNPIAETRDRIVDNRIQAAKGSI
jgi:hypothetical protein